MSSLVLKCKINGIKKKCRKSSNLLIDLTGDTNIDNRAILEASRYFKIINRVVVNNYESSTLDNDCDLVIVKMIPTHSRDITEEIKRSLGNCSVHFSSNEGTRELKPNPKINANEVLRLSSSEVLAWFGEDDPEDIAQYLASNLNNIENGLMSVSDLIRSIKYIV